MVGQALSRGSRPPKGPVGLFRSFQDVLSLAPSTLSAEPLRVSTAPAQKFRPTDKVAGVEATLGPTPTATPTIAPLIF